ncbi:ABC transporter substrate-binding protein [Adlercreutzia shanghongiae]|uniref:Extracellular solute-binding protein n=1 Tax=Adlercreutzia shanghongiae TaxID=3111773 RepID=A0ABU6IXL5_9ACTN|nr:extracellular solute-binding protein [Adlercreutzia sp. R22]MEC4294596.1 extracellular solute-binding protein [Adlercreutzia sp. R22]
MSLANTLSPRTLTRRSFCAGTAALAAAAALPLSGCSGLSATGGLTHLVIKVPRTGHDVVFDESISQVETVVQAMADDFAATYERPVEVEVIVFEQNQYDSAIVGSFDTDKAPDVLYGDYFNISTYIHTGRVVPLDDIVTPAIRDDIFDQLWEMSAIDGRTYMMPYLARQNVLAYNLEMFRNAGLDAFIAEGKITAWSLEEWTRILDALAESLPEGSFPMMMYAGSSQGDTHIMTLLRSAGSSFFDSDGHFSLSAPEGVAALRWIQDGVGRGWFPPHAENLEIEDCSSLFREGQLAIYMVNNASLGRYGDTIGLVNFPGPDADGCCTTFASGFEVFDNGDADKLEVARDFISFVYGSERWLDYAAGTLPASKQVAERYGDAILAYELFRENGDNVVDFTGNNPDTRAVRDIFYTGIHDLLMGNMTPEECAAFLDERCNAAIDEGIAESRLHE